MSVWFVWFTWIIIVAWLGTFAPLLDVSLYVLRIQATYLLCLPLLVVALDRIVWWRQFDMLDVRTVVRLQGVSSFTCVLANIVLCRVIGALVISINVMYTGWFQKNQCAFGFIFIYSIFLHCFSSSSVLELVIYESWRALSLAQDWTWNSNHSSRFGPCHIIYDINIISYLFNVIIIILSILF